MNNATVKAKRDGKSLNHYLHQDPATLEGLWSSLLCFRIRKIGLIADITKQFCQIGWQENDKVVTRFLWLRDMKKNTIQSNVERYRLTEYPLGLNLRLLLLGGTVHHHLEQNW